MKSKKTIKCEICGKPVNHPLAKYCSDECRKAGQSKYIKEWYKANKKKHIKAIKKYRKTARGKKNRAKTDKNMLKKYPKRRKARRAVEMALRNGTLIKQPCETCGVLEVEAHHEDYKKPLDVKWLCNEHHMEIDGRKVS